MPHKNLPTQLSGYSSRCSENAGCRCALAPPLNAHVTSLALDRVARGSRFHALALAPDAEVFGWASLLTADWTLLHALADPDADLTFWALDGSASQRGPDPKKDALGLPVV